MRVSIDLAKCVGQGMCVLYAPETFSLSDEDGRAQTLDQMVRPDQADAVRQAAQACPEQAIMIVE